MMAMMEMAGMMVMRGDDNDMMMMMMTMVIIIIRERSGGRRRSSRATLYPAGVLRNRAARNQSWSLSPVS